MDDYIAKDAKLQKGQFYFKLLETPLEETIEAALNSKRPETVISRQLLIMFNLLTSKVIWIVLGINFGINVIRY
jgi:hypothetical protein